LKLEAIRFRYRGLEPAREIEVEPLLYSVRSGIGGEGDRVRSARVHRRREDR